MSLICQLCNHAPATVHITDTVPEKRERHLCEACAEKEGVIVKTQHHTSHEILQQFLKQKAGMGVGDGLACPKCGTTFRDFQMKGLLGCQNDYDVFRSLLAPLIQRAHEGATKHLGKVPPSVDPLIRRETGLLRLRRELEEAVEQENYERAARVRDEIRGFEN